MKATSSFWAVSRLVIFSAAVGLVSLGSVARADLLTPTPHKGKSATVVTTVVTTVVAVDKVAPVVTITTPLNNARVTSTPITATGKATDAGRVVSVTILYQGQVYTAIGTTNWSLPLDLNPGTNNFYVWATDAAGNNSKPLMRSVFLVVDTTITVGLDGNGTVAGVVDQSNVEIGRSYHATARPASGWIFANWYDGNGVTLGTNAALTFVVQDSQVLVARFVTNLFTHLVGTYNGLYGTLNSQPQPADPSVPVVGPGLSGFITITTTKTGSFTGKVLWMASSFPISGAFQDQGDGTASSDVEITRGTNAPIEMHLVIDTNPKTGGFSGVLGSGGSVSYMSGQMQKYVAGHPKAGRYNLAVGPLGSDGSAPLGFGYGTVTVGTTGAAVLSMTLPDSTTAFSFSTGMNRDGTFPFYSSRNSGTGLIIGWLAFTNTTTADVRGSNVTWIRPATSSALYPGGFTFSPLPVFGAFYPAVTASSAPLGWSTGLISYNGDSIGGFYGDVLAYNKKLNLMTAIDSNENLLKISFAPTTGTFSGSFISPVTGKAQAFRALLIPKSDFAPLPFGVGFFLNASEAGQVTLAPF